MKKHMETFRSIFRGMMSVQFLVNDISRTDVPESAALRMRNDLFPNLVISIPAGSIRMVDDRLPREMTKAFSSSEAPISRRKRGKRGCTS